MKNATNEVKKFMNELDKMTILLENEALCDMLLPLNYDIEDENLAEKFEKDGIKLSVEKKAIDETKTLQEILTLIKEDVVIDARLIELTIEEDGCVNCEIKVMEK